MGTDHVARKRSKKQRKGAATIDKELASEGKRKRSKKNRVRKICTGMCYKPPEVLSGHSAVARFLSPCSDQFMKIGFCLMQLQPEDLDEELGGGSIAKTPCRKTKRDNAAEGTEIGHGGTLVPQRKFGIVVLTCRCPKRASDIPSAHRKEAKANHRS